MTDKRLTLRQAAAVLGVSESAVRKRVERGTLRSDKGADGRRYVYLDVPDPGADTVADEGTDTSATHERDALTSELRDRLRYVEGQLEAERQAHAEARRLLAAALERIPAIEAPRESSETVEEGEEPPDKAGSPQTATDSPQAGRERSPWWRRILGG